jgi:hypothetical protein
MDESLKREMAQRLTDALDRVVDEQSFVAFVLALAGDWEKEQELEAASPSPRYSNGALGWENGTIGAYLAAAADWADASKDGLRFYQVPTNAWRRAADILFAGKIYE